METFLLVQQDWIINQIQKLKVNFNLYYFFHVYKVFDVTRFLIGTVDALIPFLFDVGLIGL